MGYGISDLYSILPPGTRWRELWLPELINGNASLPSSIAGGHPLTLTGARKGSTADGVYFTGAATSNINCGAIHNAAAKLWVSFRFKLDQPFSASAPADLHLFGKAFDATHYVEVWFQNLDGKLNWQYRNGGVDAFRLITTETSWEAGKWYHILASLTDTGGGAQRLIIDNGTPVTDTQAALNVPNGGDFVIGDIDDPGFGAGFEGVIADFFCGTDDLTTAEEYDLYAGIPPADATNEWLLDEGRGGTAYDRGTILRATGGIVGGPFTVGEVVNGVPSGDSGRVSAQGATWIEIDDPTGAFGAGDTITGASSLATINGALVITTEESADDGTLDAAGLAAVPPTLGWAWGRVKQPILSFDRINDRVISTTGVDISGDLTLVWGGKMKSSYTGLSTTTTLDLIMAWIDANNYLEFYYSQPADLIRLTIWGSGAGSALSCPFTPTIDDYWIIVCTIEAFTSTSKLFLNGSLIDTIYDTGIIAPASTMYLGTNATGTRFDISKLLLVALIDGAFTEKQALAFSKVVNDILGLGLTI